VRALRCVRARSVSFCASARVACADAARCRAAAQVNEALKEEMKTIHALSIKRAVPPPAAAS
jgi:acid stress-induced BolA-like protein IbaG/YrbA